MRVKYQVKHRTPANIYAYVGGHVDFWIEEVNSKEVVSDVSRSNLSSPPLSTTFMPIYVAR
jgi:hypothetical protein